MRPLWDATQRQNGLLSFMPPHLPFLLCQTKTIPMQQQAAITNAMTPLAIASFDAAYEPTIAKIAAPRIKIGSISF
ncbi:MAG: hypothetical protein A2666_02120 [Parcubacteria group bacterium RIFCSPHIGHO2_01_FULL_47_10b]|nr:MAG: hypothetical protein A2666_02120 [Parcubacteria group bacterium RIFCSPHIGHO2_01_FULL_47_10b]